ncbi:effector-associated constant component EACC1 [Nocardia takedensis]|uniref:effector-associated constant component EACC1 n=1 Tax=Nocardia takedensis TaxID=259390 RepID=UPI003F766B86
MVPNLRRAEVDDDTDAAGRAEELQRLFWADSGPIDDSVRLRHDGDMSNTEGQLLIHGDANSDELTRLLDVMRYEDALRGRVRPRPVPVRPHEMGAISDALVLTVGSGGAVGIATAITRSLSVWFTHKRSELKLNLTAADGTTIKIDAKRVDTPQVLQEVEKLLEAVGRQRP